jgi:hypothetical protein
MRQSLQAAKISVIFFNSETFVSRSLAYADRQSIRVTDTTGSLERRIYRGMRDAYPITGRGRRGGRERDERGGDGFIPLHQQILDPSLARYGERVQVPIGLVNNRHKKLSNAL